MSTSLLDVLVGQQVRLIVRREEGDRAKGEEPSSREEEIVGQLLYLPGTDAEPTGFDRHAVYGEDGQRHTVWDDSVRRVEALDPASQDVILFAQCTAEPDDRTTTFGTPTHRAQCCVHEVHVGRPLGRQSPIG